MGWFRNFIENIKNKFGGNKKLLPEGKIDRVEADETELVANMPEPVSNFEGERNEFVAKVREESILSPEEKQANEENLAISDAYKCLADMVVNREFDDKKYWGQSFEKSQYRLQLEEKYKNFRHGENVPVSDHIITVCREIQYLLHEKKQYIDGYGLAQDEQLPKFLKEHNLDLKTIMTKDNGKFLNLMANTFLFKGEASYVDFNTENRSVAKASMGRAIMETLETYVQEQQSTKE